MPKPINPAIGSCPCWFDECGAESEVKRTRSSAKRLYLVCPNDGIIDLPKSKLFREYILQNAKLDGSPAPADASPAQEPAPAPAVEPAPAPALKGEAAPDAEAKPAKKKTGLLEWL